MHYWPMKLTNITNVIGDVASSSTDINPMVSVMDIPQCAGVRDMANTNTNIKLHTVE